MADFDSTSYVQRRNLDDFPAKYYPALEFSFKIDIILIEFLGKKYTQENGTSPGTPNLASTPRVYSLPLLNEISCKLVCTSLPYRIKAPMGRQ